ncbi:membrane protein [Candidatus Thiomargarita nelsonii]|uniref:Membrane protein n=1 Tax=Candidatus Thiomargarita nelsonii TaxID=1003181 RepID=A0A176S5E2_9GAMM|nr:membrane protein [Candidatus Thiomargarita nelsonii]
MNVFYRYLLTGFHLIFGEGVTMVIVGQQIIMFFLIYFLYSIGKNLYGNIVGSIAALQAIVFGRMIKFPNYLLDTTFNIAFSMAALYFLIQYSRRQRFLDCVLASLFLGIACGIRGNFVPFILGTPEASWTHQNLMGNATRIDKQINFSDKGFSPFYQTFPLYFANDVYRFNWAADDSQREKRRHFPFSAEWNGFIEVLKEDPKKGVLLAKGGHAEIEINGFKASVLNSEPLYFQLKPGIHKIQIRYARQGNGVRRLTLGWENELGKVEAIPSSRLSPTKGSLWHNRLLQNINFILYFFYIATLILVIRGNLVLFPIKRQIDLEKRIIALFFILFIIIIFSYAVSKGNQPDAQILSGGNDWLLYETQARNILMGDILDVKSQCH